MIEITPYQSIHQNRIDDMMTEIASEFNDNILSKPRSHTPNIPDAYWVAINNDKIVGTIALITVDDYGVLKKMMVKKEYRGKPLGTSKTLLETVVLWCKENNISKIYLGTMMQFKAAQSFYINNGFKRISEEKLPKNFIQNPLDSIFFVRDLNDSK